MMRLCAHLLLAIAVLGSQFFMLLPGAGGAMLCSPSGTENPALLAKLRSTVSPDLLRASGISDEDCGAHCCSAQIAAGTPGVATPVRARAIDLWAVATLPPAPDFRARARGPPLSA